MAVLIATLEGTSKILVLSSCWPVRNWEEAQIWQLPYSRLPQNPIRPQVYHYI